MSKQSANFWYQGPPQPELISAGFTEAESVINGQAFVLGESGSLSNTPQVWTDTIAAFAPHEYTGEIDWEFVCGDKVLDGIVRWPILNYIPSTSTLQFDFYWTLNKERSPRSKYSFSQIPILVSVLHSFADSIRASRLTIEPAKLPTEIAELRYDRFKALSTRKTLTSIDWVFGLRDQDEECQKLNRASSLFSLISSRNGFTLFSLFGRPLDYDLDSDMDRLKEVEHVMGLT